MEGPVVPVELQVAFDLVRQVEPPHPSVRAKALELDQLLLKVSRFRQVVLQQRGERHTVMILPVHLLMHTPPVASSLRSSHRPSGVAGMPLCAPHRTRTRTFECSRCSLRSTGRRQPGSLQCCSSHLHAQGLAHTTLCHCAPAFYPHSAPNVYHSHPAEAPLGGRA